MSKKRGSPLFLLVRDLAGRRAANSGGSIGKTWERGRGGVPKLVNLQVKELPRMYVVGRAIRVKMDMEENPIPALWDRCFAEGTFETLEALEDYHLDKDYVGWLGDWSEDSFVYICGMLMKPEVPVPEGFDWRELAPAKAGVGWIKGRVPEVLFHAHDLTLEALLEAGYEPDHGAGWSMELYNCPRYTNPDENGELILDYYIAVK